MNQDDQHLKLLSIFHYVVGGILALFSLLPLIHVGVGVAMLSASSSPQSRGQPPPEWFAWMFIAIGSVVILLGLAVAVSVLIAGACLARRRHHLYCMVMAGIECFFMPLGTVLGVFSLVVLLRDSVKELFAAGDGAEAQAASE